MFFVILFLTQERAYTAVAFLVGALISIACGAIGMIIATRANYRTTYCAKRGLAQAFKTAYRSGCSMGFALVSLGLLSKQKKYLSPDGSHPYLQEHQGP